MGYKLKEFSKHLEIHFKGKCVHSVKKSTLKGSGKDVERFINVYKRFQKKFYGREVFKKVSPNSKNYQHFKEACQLAKSHEAEFSEYIKAQIEGLSFANKFPSPNQLATDMAEQRYLDYKSEASARNKKIPFTEKDETTPLTENKKYLEIVERFKQDEATYHEVRYVALCQKYRKGVISRKVRRFLKNAKKA